MSLDLQSPERVSKLALVLLLALTTAAYIGVVQAGFVWDDVGLVTGNDRLASLRNLPSFFGGDLWQGVKGVEAPSGYYRPVFLSYLATVRSLVGESAPALHLLGLGWHLAAVSALYLLLERLLGPVRAAAGATLFALHPVQSEAVVWIAANNDPMAVALGLFALGLALPAEARTPRLLAAGGLMAASALSKESTLLLPLVLPLLDRARGIPMFSRRFVALCAGVALAVGLRIAVGVAGAPPSSLGWALLRDQALSVIGLAGSLLVWPWPLSGSRPLDWPLAETWRIVLGFLTLGVLLLCAVACKPRRGLVWAGLALVALGLAPVVLAIAGKGLFGERYLYLPLAGVALVVSAALPSRLSRLFPLVAVPWLVVLYLRLPDWADDLSLWEAAMRDTPNPHAAQGMADTYNIRHEYPHALHYFVLALSGDPPAYVACPRVVNIPLRLGWRELAQQLARWAATRGCTGVGEFVGAAALAEAVNGDWDAARAMLGRARVPDPTGVDEVVAAALLRVEGDLTTYDRRAAAWTGSVPLDDQVRTVLVAGGRPDLVPGADAHVQ